jgi:hypothetical protein
LRYSIYFALSLCLERLSDALLAVTNAHFDAKLLVNEFGQVLGRVDAAVLAAGATKGEHQVGETTLNVSCHMRFGQGINVFEECENFSVVLEKIYDGLV